MIGTAFENSVYSRTIAANVAIVIMISTGWGRYELQLYGRFFVASDGTTIKKRSSHIPTTIVDDAITHPVIVRNFLIARIGKGITKLQNTIVQNSGAYDPVCVSQNTAISADEFPYQVVIRSTKVK